MYTSLFISGLFAHFPVKWWFPPFGFASVKIEQEATESTENPIDISLWSLLFAVYERFLSLSSPLASVKNKTAFAPFGGAQIRGHLQSIDVQPGPVCPRDCPPILIDNVP